MTLREPFDVRAQRRLEAPLRLRRMAVGGRRVPPALRNSVTSQVRLHAWPTVRVLVRTGAAERPMLEDVTLTDARRRPREPALDEEHRRAGLE